MHKPPLLTSNFAHLQEHDEQLLRLGMLAERYFPDDPNTTLLKLRQLTELLAQLVATKVGLYQSPEESQYDLLRRRLQKLLASRQWSTPQRQWLQKIAAQTKANMLVDREALDDPDLVFRREGGGFARLDRIFGGELQQVLDTFNESLWPPAA